MMMLLYFGTMVVLSVFETVGTPLTMDEYGWDPQTVCSSLLCVLSEGGYWKWCHCWSLWGCLRFRFCNRQEIGNSQGGLSNHI